MRQIEIISCLNTNQSKIELMRLQIPTTPAAPLRILADVYGVSQSTLHRWSERGVMRDDLADPQRVLEKLQATAKNDGVSLWRLSHPENVKTIRAKLAALNPKP
jgi:hypothetical protein